MNIKTFFTNKQETEMWLKLAAVLTSVKTVEQVPAAEQYARLWYERMKQGLGFGPSFKLWLDVRDMIQEMQLRVKA